MVALALDIQVQAFLIYPRNGNSTQLKLFTIPLSLFTIGIVPIHTLPKGEHANAPVLQLHRTSALEGVEVPIAGKTQRIPEAQGRLHLCPCLR